MSKAQKRGNREVKKPKKIREQPVVASGLTKGLLEPIGSQKKKH